MEKRKPTEYSYIMIGHADKILRVMGHAETLLRELGEE